MKQNNITIKLSRDNGMKKKKKNKYKVRSDEEKDRKTL